LDLIPIKAYLKMLIEDALRSAEGEKMRRFLNPEILTIS